MMNILKIILIVKKILIIFFKLIKGGVNMFNIISLTEDFFLSISIDNFCEDNLRFEINFFSPYLNKNLSQIQINEKKNIKQIFSFKKLEEGQITSIDDLIQIRWESLDMKAKGILQIKESIETFKNKIFKCPVFYINF